MKWTERLPNPPTPGSLGWLRISIDFNSDLDASMGTPDIPPRKIEHECVCGAFGNHPSSCPRCGRKRWGELQTIK
jgi:hypothetical protein